MILTRLGNKRHSMKEIYQYFPPHKLRIEFFFGAGGAFFNVPKAKYSILNDIDNDVTNLFTVLVNQKDELINQIKLVPIAQGLIRHWKSNQETDPIKKAVRFLFLSNFTYLGKGDTLRVGIGNEKETILKRIEKTFDHLGSAKITNLDFRDVLKSISFSETVITKEKSFGYLDPVYLDSEHYYNCPKWTISDTKDCFEIMKTSGIRCAMSEYATKEVLDFADEYKMNVIHFKTRRKVNTKKPEILITNYDHSHNSLFSL